MSCPVRPTRSGWRRVAAVVGFGLIALAAGAGAAAAAEVPQALLDRAQSAGGVRVVVRLDAPFTPEGELPGDAAVSAQRRAIAAAADAVLADLGGASHRVVRRFDEIPFLALDLSPAGLAGLAGSRAAAAVSEDARGQLALDSSVPLVEGPLAWAAGYTGAGRTVAVLDTGVDRTHPFLAGRVVAEACFSDPDPLLGVPPGCPNGQPTQVGPGAAPPCGFNLAGCSHGTHVAGIVAGSTPAYFNGVAKGAGILAVYVYYNQGGIPSWWGADVAAGLSHVYSLRDSYAIAAANASLQGPLHTSACDNASPAMQMIKAAIDNLRSVGIATVISAGNRYATNALGEPACISTAVSVGAVTDQDAVAPFSNSSSQLDLLAPGVGVASSVPGGGYNFYDGTSMAAPHVAGAWAVLRQFAPGASVDQVLGALATTGKPVLDPRNGLTRPRIRVFEALRALGFSPPLRPRLAVTLAGTGRGTVSGPGISCPVDCEERYDSGTQVTLTATPDSFSRFAGWSGACAGTAACTLAMAGDRAVTATFNPQSFQFDTLNVTVVGSGTIGGPGISCPGDCTEGYGRGTVVTLSQSAAADWRFVGWSGACSGSAGCAVTMSGNLSVTATFAANPGGGTVRRLSVSVSGGGRVFGPGIACAPDCSQDYADGVVVDLAAEGMGGAFQGWGGACSGTVTRCRVTMSADRSVSAAFAAAPPPVPQALLQVGIQPSGTPRLRVSGPGIYCPPVCNASYPVNTVVSLQAETIGYAQWCTALGSWTGACAGQGSRCLLQMSDHRQVTRIDHGRVICGVPPPNLGAYVAAGVSGAGTVAGPGISCRSDPYLDPAGCSELFPAGAGAVTLSAAPDPGRRFAGWEGSCAGAGPVCTVPAGASAGTAAGFALLAPPGPGPHRFEVSVVGGGTVTSASGLACRSSPALQPDGCADLVAGGSVLTVTAEPDAGWQLAGWGGACAGQPAVCAVTVETAASAQALFVAPPPYDLEVAVSGEGTVRGGDRPDQSGCCSHHDGVCGCFGGRVQCCDGTLSPTCNCVQIDCPGDCAHSYQTFTRVSLGAEPAAGWELDGWGGACAGQGDPCSLGLGDDALVEAHFRRPQVRLELAATGDGAVAGPAIACPPGCAAAYDPGTEVTLNAAPAPGWQLAGWDGACAGQGAACTLTLEADAAAGVRFAEPLVSLTVTPTGAGSGRVTSTPPGIDCGTACAAGFLAGTEVALTPAPEPGSVFAGWGGDADCADGALEPTAPAAPIACAAAFAPRDHTLLVARQGSGAGRVTSTPPGIDCGEVCAVPFAAATAVALTAAAGPGSVFAGWQGDADCADGTVTLDSPVVCTALFDAAGAGGDATAAGTAGAAAGGATWIAVTAPFTGDRDGDGHAVFELAADPGGPWTPWPGGAGIPGPPEWRTAVFAGLDPDTAYWARVGYEDPDGVVGEALQVVGPVTTAALFDAAATAGPAAVVPAGEELLVAVPIAGDDDGDSTGLVEIARHPAGPWEPRCGPPLPFHPKLCRLRGLEPGADVWVRATVDDPAGVAGAAVQVVGPVAYGGAADLALGRPVEADSGWGCCPDPAALTDGVIQYPDWPYGFAWTGGTGGWGGGGPGWKQATVDLGAPRRFDRVRVWTHDPAAVPAAWRVETSDDLDAWTPVLTASQPTCRTAAAPLAVSWSFPSCALVADFPPVTARFVRFAFDDATLFDGLHGWAVELEVLAAADCAFAISAPGAAAPAGGGPGTVTVAAPPGCAWSASPEADWLAVAPPAEGDGDGAVTYFVAANPQSAARTGELTVAGRRFAVVQEGAACAPAVVPGGIQLPAAGGAGGFAVGVPAGCVWEAAAGAGWIALDTDGGIGPGAVGFTVAGNPDPAPRLATIAVAGAGFTVDQDGFAPDPDGSVTAPPAAAAGGGTWIEVAAPVGGDPDGDGWSGFELGASGEGPWTPWTGRDGAVGVPGPAGWRRAVLGGLDPGSTYFVRVTAHDPDGVSGDNPRVVGPIATAAPRDDVVAGTATAVAGDDEILVSLPIAGDDDRSSDATVETAPGPAGPWSLRCGPGMPFAPKLCRVRAPAPGVPVWLRVTVSDEDGVSGVNPQVLGPVVAAGRRDLALGRAVTADPGWGCCDDPAALVDGAVQQPGEDLGFSWTGGSGGWAGGPAGWKQATVDLGGRLTFDRVAAWLHDPASVPADWRFEISDDGAAFTPLAAAAGAPPCRTPDAPLATGWDFPSCAHELLLDPPATARWVRYGFDDRTLFAGRHGWAVELEVLSGCGYALGAPGAGFGEAGGGGSVAVTAAAGCVWEAVSEAPWVTITGGASGAGPGTVGYAVAANPAAAPRAATLTIAGHAFTVTQDPASCAVALEPETAVFGPAGGGGTVAVAIPAGCPWTAVSPDPWIAVAAGGGVGPGAVTYQVATHPGGPPRVGSISVGGAVAAVHQNPAACSFSIAPPGTVVGGGGGAGTVEVTAGVGCGWTAVAEAQWIAVAAGAVGSGDGAVAWAAERNTGAGRSGTIAVAGSAFTVDQPCRDGVADGGFEAGTAATRWLEISSHQAPLLCDPARCGIAGAAEGAWWAWLGGVAGEPEVAALEQVVTVPEGGATLRFELSIPSAGGNGVDRLRAVVDGVEVFAAGEGDPVYAAGYAPVAVDLAAFADGGVHLLRLEATLAGAVPLTHFFVDRVGIEGCEPSAVLFADGFESGGLAGWSAAVGP